MLPAPSSPARRTNRIEALDLARGIAVTLMILSHGVKGLLTFEQFPQWGLVPVHLITKFSSTLFFLVFGLTLAVSFLPSVGTPQWPAKRKKLLLRGLKILFWYKVLTIVEMFHLYSREDILETLLYRAFTSYVEILGFYGIALLWIPFALPVWKAAPAWIRWPSPFAFALLSQLLFDRFDFRGNEGLQALLVEHPDHYTWGQLARAPLVCAGLLIGETVRANYGDFRRRLLIVWDLSVTSFVLLAGFLVLASGDLQTVLRQIALNEGKHPPESTFMLFSLSGALFLLSGVLLGGERLSIWLSPLTTIGKEALNAFIFHIFVLFVFYRYLFDYWQKVSYERALTLALLLIVLTFLWIRIKNWVLRESSSPSH